MRYPILMADILGSSIKDAKTLMVQLKKIVSIINKSQEKNLRSPLTVTLGDEFQGLINSIEHAVRLIFEMEELIIKNKFDLKLRYVINYGEIETPINRKIAYGMLGKGLTEARQKINELKKEDTRFILMTDNRINYYVNKAFSLYQNIIDTWKKKDMATVSAFLEKDDYKKVAKHIKTNPSSAWRRKKSLRINEYHSIKEIILHLLTKE